MDFQVTEKTAAKLPNGFTHTVKFNVLNGLAIKAFLYVTARLQKEHREAVTFKWAELAAYLSDRPSDDLSGSEYLRYSRALTGLVTVTIFFAASNGSKQEHTLFKNWKYNSATKEITVTMNPDFKRLLDSMGRNFFTLVYLEEARKLDDARQLRLLLWCFELMLMEQPGYRRLSVKELKDGLGMDGKRYKNWRGVYNKVQECLASINARTGFDVSITTVKEGKRVTEVEFDIDHPRKRLHFKKRR